MPCVSRAPADRSGSPVEESQEVDVGSTESARGRDASEPARARGAGGGARGEGERTDGARTGRAGAGGARWSGIADLEPIVRRFLARRCRDANELDDMVQETLLRAARYRTGLGDPQRLQGWALSIAGNCLREHVRRECRVPRSPPGSAVEEASGVQPGPCAAVELVRLGRRGKTVEKDTALAELERVLRGMRAADRSVLRAFYSRGADCDRIAMECDIPRDLVKVRLFRARRRLLRVLERRLVAQSRMAGSVGRRSRRRRGDVA